MDTYNFSVPLSGPVPATGQYGQNYAGRFYITQTIDPANAEYCRIDWRFCIWDAIGSSQYNYNNGNQCKVMIDDDVKVNSANIKPVALSGTSEANPLVLCSGSQNVAFGANGTCKVKVYADYYQPNASALQHIRIPQDGNYVEVELHSITSAAQIASCPDMILNGSNDHTVGWNSSHAGCYYQVTYKYGDTTLHTSPMLQGTGSAMTYTWADVPVDIAEYAPAASSMDIDVTLGTYTEPSIAAVIGTDSDSFTMTFDPGYMGPEIGEISLAWSGLQGDAIVGGHTSVTATFTVEAHSGAEIDSVYGVYAKYNESAGTWTEITGTKVISGSPIALAAFPNTVFNDAESLLFSVKIVATDSRGYSSTKYTDPITAYYLAAPVIGMVSLSRCNAQGVDDSVGNYFNAHVSFTISMLNGENEKHLGISYFFVEDEDDPSEWITPTVADPAGYNQTVTLGPYPLPEGTGPVGAIVYCWDAFTASNKASMEARLMGGAYAMAFRENANKDKTAIGFGGYSDADGQVQSFWPVIAEDGLKVFLNRGLSGELSVRMDGSKITFVDENDIERVKVDMTGVTLKNDSGTTTATKTWAQILGS